ncbi:hypothetical protein [Thiothrix nivea]|uniref:Cadherin n=1 Tax=Thiothrix nivea (strain ATCC 35100 / DSM 5205 / JP2) TaxID=870187 RepID=A0A656HFG5_THINJ|nr:hypothetical protein [Thiothrix nivea]EIJ34140.1 hypothetical protein Thini_1538 [Thiothrix nivea DSM 5205]
MNTKKSALLLCRVVGSIVLATAGNAAFADNGLEYKLALAEDGQTYQLWMKPASTPKPDFSLTGQVTIKAPHTSNFSVTKLASGIEDVSWVEASRVDAPAEDTGHDYISFSFIGVQGNSARNYEWQQDQEKLVFSFENKNGCQEGVALMANDDPFNIETNSANTNPGNQFTNLGWGAVSENNYTGNYGETITCKK